MKKQKKIPKEVIEMCKRNGKSIWKNLVWYYNMTEEQKKRLEL